MSDEELIDELVEENYTQVLIHWADLKTDDDDGMLAERLILELDGSILARRICQPDCYGWSRVYHSSRSPLSPLPAQIYQLDLKDKAHSLGMISNISSNL